MLLYETFSKGELITLDLELARHHLEVAAELGHAHVICDLGISHIDAAHRWFFNFTWWHFPHRLVGVIVMDLNVTTYWYYLKQCLQMPRLNFLPLMLLPIPRPQFRQFPSDSHFLEACSTCSCLRWFSEKIQGKFGIIHTSRVTWTCSCKSSDSGWLGGFRFDSWQ